MGRASLAFMAFSTGRGANINVTPLIDILLVLLVIFLVAMPIVMRQEHVEVSPKDQTDVMPSEPVIAVSLHADLTYTIDDGLPINASDLPRTISTRLGAAHSILLAADDGVAWKEVVTTIDTLSSMEGVERVALGGKP